MKTNKRLTAVLAVFCCGAPLGASSIPAVTDEDLVKKSEFIFQGTVARIDYRKSGFRTRTDVQLPHTFVTFQVERILKGKHTGASNRFTMRHIGGPDPAASRFLEVDGCPDFDIGERVVIFVRRNERSICPMVGWPQGKYRVAGGAVFSDSGREVWLTPQKKLALGPKHDLPEVKTHHRGGKVFLYRVSGPNNSEGTAAPRPMQGVRLDVGGFLAYIGGLVTTLHSAGDLSRLEAVRSADVDQPFYMTQPSDAGDRSTQ